jgi:predicted transcriptional regulator YdeE
MVLQLDETETERRGGFTIAGVAERDTDVDEARVWRALGDHEDVLGDAAVSDDRYGVLYDLDEGSGEFTYVAGVEVEDTDGLGPELTVVEIPEATYAVLAPTAETVDDLVREIEAEGYGDDDRAAGPMFVHYDADEDPVAPEAALEFYVPVDEGEEY